jgi:hypothetical protein
MPYKIQPVFGGFVVKKGKKAFSKKPLTLKRAKAQRTAIILSGLRPR